ncbi:MAG TPA: hypothetical protein VKT32_02905 [Chthonomonadaceae bacterium]|nr:hypothetical protein [Chthonomonadaceae bacterium]
MHTKRTGLCGILGLALLAAALPASAGTIRIEKSLIGIRMLQSYRDVLRKFGPPTRVYRNDETVGLIEAYDKKGNPTGGILGFSDSLAALGGGQTGAPPTMRGMAGFPGGMGSFPGGMGGYPGGKPSVGPMGVGGSGGAMGGRRGMMMGGGGPPGGFPGFPGGGPPMGMPGMAGRPGSMGGTGGFGGGVTNPTSDANAPSPRVGSYIGGETFEDAGGFKWVYLYPKQQLLYEFIFNQDGRVEIILERGRALGAPTSRGIRLASSTRAVLDTYGWPDSIEDEGISFGFSYIRKDHVEFTITRDKVTGIAVFLREDQRIRFLQEGAQLARQGSAPGGMAGMMGGRPGMGMMGTRPGMGGMGGGPQAPPAGGGGKSGAE